MKEPKNLEKRNLALNRETLYAIIITYFVAVRDVKASYKKPLDATHRQGNEQRGSP